MDPPLPLGALRTDTSIQFVQFFRCSPVPIERDNSDDDASDAADSDADTESSASELEDDELGDVVSARSPPGLLGCDSSDAAQAVQIVASDPPAVELSAGAAASGSPLDSAAACTAADPSELLTPGQPAADQATDGSAAPAAPGAIGRSVLSPETEQGGGSRGGASDAVSETLPSGDDGPAQKRLRCLTIPEARCNKSTAGPSPRSPTGLLQPVVLFGAGGDVAGPAGVTSDLDGGGEDVERQTKRRRQDPPTFDLAIDPAGGRPEARAGPSVPKLLPTADGVPTQRTSTLRPSEPSWSNR